MKKGLITILSAFIGLATFQNCANITAPTGGDKDIVAPQLVKSNPTNNTTNFKLKTIITKKGVWFQPYWKDKGAVQRRENDHSHYALTLGH